MNFEIRVNDPGCLSSLMAPITIPRSEHTVDIFIDRVAKAYAIDKNLVAVLSLNQLVRMYWADGQMWEPTYLECRHNHFHIGRDIGGDISPPLRQYVEDSFRTMEFKPTQYSDITLERYNEEYQLGIRHAVEVNDWFETGNIVDIKKIHGNVVKKLTDAVHEPIGASSPETQQAVHNDDFLKPRTTAEVFKDCKLTTVYDSGLVVLKKSSSLDEFYVGTMGISSIEEYLLDLDVTLRENELLILTSCAPAISSVIVPGAVKRRAKFPLYITKEIKTGVMMLEFTILTI